MMNWPSLTLSRIQEKRILIALDRFCLIVLLARPTAHELSACIGVAGCGCPMSSSVLRNMQPSLALWKRAANSASAAEEHTGWMMELLTKTGPLNGGEGSSGLGVGFWSC